MFINVLPLGSVPAPHSAGGFAPAAPSTSALSIISLLEKITGMQHDLLSTSISILELNPQLR
ncbi:hypothetical protein VW29_18145 [Devosia limi DSM 17137]|uniref:Uncharacterized protein n=1 Tax=Devosia limi DSM 17137 TaxID=1121477 RepID=A0A0F5L4F2_9HYPH|nr:hypothetical protein VW29_18145 [Devosia limi DSM 17137]